MQHEKVLVAMSGGVDSAVAAALLQEAGYDCRGAMMHLHNCGGCGSADDAADASAIAERLGIPFSILPFEDIFRANVIDRFVCSYEAGETPNPCIDCNRYLKFGSLAAYAEAAGCDKLATGHYARIRSENGRFLLLRAVDPTKDQSYVLYNLTQAQLARTLFPLGEFTKERVRELAAERHFCNAHKADSQDLCFVPDGDYARAIESFTGKIYPEGNFVDRNGAVLGRHRGQIRYTVGQRRGLGLALPEPFYVVEKRLADNTVVLGRDSDLRKRALTADDCNWIAYPSLSAPLRVQAKVRYRQAAEEATLIQTGEHTARVEFDRPQRAITVGQAVVFYEGDVVVGGGRIRTVEEEA